MSLNKEREALALLKERWFTFVNDPINIFVQGLGKARDAMLLRALAELAAEEAGEHLTRQEFMELMMQAYDDARRPLSLSEELLLKPIEEIECSVLLATVLQTASARGPGYTGPPLPLLLLGEIVQASRRDFRGIRQCKKSSLDELEEILDDHGLRLGMTLSAANKETLSLKQAERTLQR